MSKAASTPIAFIEIIDNFKVGLYHGDEYQLCDAVALFNGEAVGAAVPA